MVKPIQTPARPNVQASKITLKGNVKVYSGKKKEARSNPAAGFS
jgi:hypothetical protein